MSPLLISSNVSVPPPPLSMCPPPPHLPSTSLHVTALFSDDGDEDFEGEHEEDRPESDPEIDLNLDLESNYDSVLPSSYLSSSSSSSLLCCQPWRRRSSASPTWYLPQKPPSSMRAIYPPAPSSLSYCWSHHIHHSSFPNCIWTRSQSRNLPPLSIPLCRQPPPPPSYFSSIYAV